MLFVFWLAFSLFPAVFVISTLVWRKECCLAHLWILLCIATERAFVLYPKSAWCYLFMWFKAMCHGKHVRLVSSQPDLTNACVWLQVCYCMEESLAQLLSYGKRKSKFWNLPKQENGNNSFCAGNRSTSVLWCCMESYCVGQCSQKPVCWG